MDGVKGLLASKTVWGVLISMGGKLAAVFGYNLTEGDEQVLITTISVIASAIGDIYALYGRVKATKKIG